MSITIRAKDSQFIAISTLHHHLDQLPRSNLEKIWILDLFRIHMNVENFILSVDSIEEAILVRREITDILRGMKIRIKNWH